MEFIESLKIAEYVLEQFKKDHPKWWKKIDGTPIPNDLAVRMAIAYQSVAPMEPTNKEEK